LNQLWPARFPDKVAQELKILQDRIAHHIEKLEQKRALLPTVRYPEQLPISAQVEAIRGQLGANPVVVISGATGSGKTTQLPKICLEMGYGLRGKIVCTQPRRVAASSLSQRIAQELGVNWGREVGCKIRFTDKTSHETVIKVVTDGMLLSEIHSDPDLLEYEVIIVDEAHERSLNIDFLLGYLQQLLERRADL
jgi:ATP-dependent helicase HrpA